HSCACNSYPRHCGDRRKFHAMGTRNSPAWAWVFAWAMAGMAVVTGSGCLCIQWPGGFFPVFNDRNPCRAPAGRHLSSLVRQLCSWPETFPRSPAHSRRRYRVLLALYVGVVAVRVRIAVVVWVPDHNLTNAKTDVTHISSSIHNLRNSNPLSGLLGSYPRGDR